MTTCKVRFRLLSFWHAGTSHGLGAEVDAQVARTPGGLPYLPGRTVKGLLRHGLRCAVAAGAIAPGREEALCGSGCPTPGTDRREERLEEMRFETRAGALRFGSAVLVDATDDCGAWEKYARSEAGRRRVPGLFTSLSSTAIDADGIAKSQSLRTIEVTVPVDLVAEVSGPDDDDTWANDLREACLFLAGLGSGRNRGLGRVNVEVL